MGEVINWMGGWPKDGLLSAEEWEEMRREQAQAARAAVQERAAAPGGMLPELRERIAAGWLGSKATAPGASASIWAAAGADAALQLAFKRLLRPGDIVLTERPANRMALQAIRRAGAVPVGVRGDSGGMDPDAVAEAIEELKPKMVYAAPACTDPEGRVWSGERVAALAERCAEGGVKLLLDERQAALAEQPEMRPAGAGGEREAPGGAAGADIEEAAEEGATVLVLRELPPGLIGGLRFAWLFGSGLTDAEERSLAQAYALPGEAESVSAADQLALLAYAEQPVEPALATLRFVYRTRQTLLAEALGRHGWSEALPAEAPAGVHTWLALPLGLDAEALLRASWLKGVLFQPGAAFYASKPDPFKLRLTAVHSDEKEIKEGVRRIGEAIGEFMGRSSV
ncbi:aminotransferase class I/II-fold pyridoxal phosphate-dependent enzyme [Cohnella sp. REN36]|uniref:aminotransferase class I/II-fold pyridoxal phosphate-dependent enzyme n=1 Tax=Cohnella sp. REN36 TaxID=2887347 RepID=UPI001D14ED0F|nr:aminotransferase class I/II-fold pyridoxal phosphate-dependent enzyme [Cohnella sp. REN36]MCC3375486.1 aminotransferase class I/II-fold pyridoxal phosphate-dependent enzyme [Cohnella sp. REN36]